MTEMRPRTCRVVVVDDNVDAAETMSMLFQAQGWDVRTEHDGRQGLATIYQHLPHVAVVDLGLPTMTGWEIAQHARATFGPHIYLVTVSGWSAEEDVVTAKAAGFDMHFAKPVDPLSMIRLVADGCAGQQGPAPGPQGP